MKGPPKDEGRSMSFRGTTVSRAQVLNFTGVYRRSSRSNDLRKLLKIDSPRHAWKTDIGTGFIDGESLGMRDEGPNPGDTVTE